MYKFKAETMKGLLTND